MIDQALKPTSSRFPALADKPDPLSPESSVTICHRIPLKNVRQKLAVCRRVSSCLQLRAVILPVRAMRFLEFLVVFSFRLCCPRGLGFLADGRRWTPTRNCPPKVRRLRGRQAKEIRSNPVLERVVLQLPPLTRRRKYRERRGGRWVGGGVNSIYVALVF